MRSPTKPAIGRRGEHERSAAAHRCVPGDAGRRAGRCSQHHRGLSPRLGAVPRRFWPAAMSSSSPPSRRTYRAGSPHPRPPDSAQHRGHAGSRRCASSTSSCSPRATSTPIRRTATPARASSARLPKTLSVAEVDRLIDTAARRAEAVEGIEHLRALRLYCLIEMLYATGMRVSELVSLPRTRAGRRRARSDHQGQGRPRTPRAAERIGAGSARPLSRRRHRARAASRPSGCFRRRARRATSRASASPRI